LGLWAAKLVGGREALLPGGGGREALLLFLPLKPLGKAQPPRRGGPKPLGEAPRGAKLPLPPAALPLGAGAPKSSKKKKGMGEGGGRGA
jgi:hypothetical protein